MTLSEREKRIRQSVITAFHGSKHQMVQFVLCQAENDPAPCALCRDLVRGVQNSFSARTRPRVAGRFA